MPVFSVTIKKPARSSSGLTLIEILVVTVIIALMASLSFPVYKIMQQREKERRLTKILNDVRAAIAGSKSQQSATAFQEGYRTYIRVKGIEAIKAAHPLPADANIASAAIATFVYNLADKGLGYPLTPSHLTFNHKYKVTVATGPTDEEPTAGSVEIEIDRRFLRTLPPHPFSGWFPTATWTFKPAYPANSSPISSAAWNPAVHKGVIDILSSGAGMALDGSSTNDK